MFPEDVFEWDKPAATNVSVRSLRDERGSQSSLLVYRIHHEWHIYETMKTTGSRDIRMHGITIGTRMVMNPDHDDGEETEEELLYPYAIGP